MPRRLVSPGAYARPAYQRPSTASPSQLPVVLGRWRPQLRRAPLPLTGRGTRRLAAPSRAGSPGALARIGVVWPGWSSWPASPAGSWRPAGCGWTRRSRSISPNCLATMPGALVQDGSPPLYYLLHYWMLVFGQGDFAVRAFPGSSPTPPCLSCGRPASAPAAAVGVGRPPARGQLAVGHLLRHRHPHVLAHGPGGHPVVPGRPPGPRAPEPGPAGWRGGCDRRLDVHPLLGPLPGRRGRAWALWRAWGESRTGVPRARTRSPGAARKVAMGHVPGLACGSRGPPSSVPGRCTPARPGPPRRGRRTCSRCSATSRVRALGLAAHLHALRPGWPGPLRRPGPTGASVVIEVRVQPRARFVALLVVGPLGVAVLAGMLTGAAFDNRYIAVVFPLFIVLCALGVTTFRSRKVTAAMLAVACAAGLFTAQGAELAAPDRRPCRSPPTSTLRPSRATWSSTAQTSWDRRWTGCSRCPTSPSSLFLVMIGPARVDWVDYVSDHPEHRRRDLCPGRTRTVSTRAARSGWSGATATRASAQLRGPGELAADAAPGRSDVRTQDPTITSTRTSRVPELSLVAIEPGGSSPRAST